MIYEGGQEWERYWDEEQSAHYWYNSNTGESRWADDDDEQDNEGVELLNRTNKKKQDEKMKTSESNLNEEDVDTSRRGHRDKKKNKRDKKKSKRKPDYDDDEYIEMIRDSELVQRTGVDINRYRLCFYLNILLLEYPLVVLEGFVRVLLLLILMTMLLVASIMLCGFKNCTSSSLSYLFLIGREVVVTSAAISSLIVPFVIFIIYRDYDAENTWDLSPLPTIIGHVDPRRFLVITLGSASEADNIDIDITGRKCKTMDKFGGGSIDNMVLFPRVFLKHILD